MQEKVFLPAGESLEQPVPKAFSDLSAEGLSGRQTEIPRRDGRSGPTSRVRSSVPTDGADQMGCLCETAFWWTGAGSEVSGALHTSGGHLESAAVVDGRWPRDF